MRKVIVLLFLSFIVFSASAQNQQAPQTNKKNNFTNVEIKIPEINKGITKYIKDNYSGFTIENAVKLLKNGEIFKYKINIIKGENKKTLMFDTEYKFIEELETKAVKPDRVNPPAEENNNQN